jgi:hypothetical protein
VIDKRARAGYPEHKFPVQEVDMANEQGVGSLFGKIEGAVGGVLKGQGAGGAEQLLGAAKELAAGGGKQEDLLALAKKLFDGGIDVSKIAEATKLPLDLIKEKLGIK